MSDAVESQGFKLEIGDGDSPEQMVEVKEIKSFNGLDGQASVIDVTHMRSVAKEKRMGLQDFGQFQGDVNYLPDDPGQLLLRAAKASRAIKNFKGTLADGSTFEFTAFVLSSPISGGVDAVIEGSFALEISGDVTGTAITGTP